jgi:hypothetical protein
MATVPISFKATPEVKAAIDAKAIALGISKGQLLNDVWQRYTGSEDPDRLPTATESPKLTIYQCHACADVHPDPDPIPQKLCSCPACGKRTLHRIYDGPIE